MRIVHIVPGSGGTFYCENCMRDASLVKALRASGHDVIMTPLYLPLFLDDKSLARGVPVFFGGINVYLQQKFALFRRTPRWLDRVFDARWVLRRAAAMEGTTSPADLGPMTLSMLRGEEGHQRKEVERLVLWLRDHARPDVVHISNALLLGLAGEMKRMLGVPVICSLQDEDTWLDAMAEPHAGACWKAMAEAARHVDLFVAVSRWYADQMHDRLLIPREKLRVVPLGVEVDDTPPASRTGPPAIGYLSRMCEAHGLDRLVEAFVALKKNPALRALKLRVTGGETTADERFVQHIRDILRREGVSDDFELLPDFGKAGRREFLRSLSVLSVPMEQGEAFGTFILEALAQGVPVVQPRAGGFTEVVEATGGGLLYDPSDKGALANALERLLLDPAHARKLGEKGRIAVRGRFTINHMAERLVDLYGEIVPGRPL